jgi:hypothetical protein
MKPNTFNGSLKVSDGALKYVKFFWTFFIGSVRCPWYRSEASSIRRPNS